MYSISSTGDTGVIVLSNEMIIDTIIDTILMHVWDTISCLKISSAAKVIYLTFSCC